MSASAGHLVRSGDDTLSGLKLVVRGTFSSLKRCSCLLADTGDPNSNVWLSSRTLPFIWMFACGAMGAIVRKKGLSAATASSNKLYAF